MSEHSPSPGSTKPWMPSGDFPTLFDRYQVLGVLGRGGMGTVLKGFHLSLKRFVAIKVIRLDSVHCPELVSRFLREMEAIGQMDHPNVVRATDAGEKNGVFYLVMEYLTGSDLANLIDARGPLEAVDACELVRQAALGLDYAHQTLVHRDVKPSNLLLTPAGVVKVLDLGLARLHEAGTTDQERTPEGRVMGTYDYLAPEQATGRGRIDGRADIYSLGCTLFRLLTGRAPFDGPHYTSAARKLFGHCHVPLTAVEGFSALPEELRPVLVRMMAKDPNKRYPSAAEVAQALARFTAGSQPARLVTGLEAAEPAVEPLICPLPEELYRLTAIAEETRPVTSPPLAPRMPGIHRRHVLAAGLVGCAVAGTAWLLASVMPPPTGGLSDAAMKPDGAGRNDIGQPPVPTVRALDELEPHRYHALLDCMPIPIDPGGRNLGQWQWEEGRQVVEVRAPGLLLLSLGTTARPYFTFEAGITQAPWAGRVGLFWGYVEDATARAAKTSGQKFADFQVILLARRTGPRGEEVPAVERGRGWLWYDADGVIQLGSFWAAQQDIPPLAAGEKILAISVRDKRLAQAVLGPLPLSRLCSREANAQLTASQYQGGLGLISLGHHATFSNVRFIAEPAN